MMPLVHEKVLAKNIQIKTRFQKTSTPIPAEIFRNPDSQPHQQCGQIYPERGNDYPSSREKGKWNQISITDTGIGMTQEKIKEIFEIRHKSPVVGTGGELGSGIGLALSSQLFQKILGNLATESSPGEGSRFILTFPDLIPEDLQE